MPLTPVLYGRRQGFICRPLQSLDARMECHLFYTQFIAPLLHCLSFAAPRKKTVVASIISLFFSRGPSTIIRRVVAIIVYAVKRTSFWRRSHIGVEILEGLPSFAYADSSSSVSGKTRVIAVLATNPHRYPNCVHGAIAHAVRCFSSHSDKRTAETVK